MTSIILPYVQVPTWPVDVPVLGTHTITVFGLLVAVGVMLGLRLTMHHARVRGVDTRTVDWLAVRVFVVGLITAHWVSVVFYYPDRIATEPWILLDFTSGLSSMGGFVGGLLGFLWLTRRRGLDALAYADSIAFGLLAGFTLGRLGCSLVHDHPGVVTSPERWLAVGPWPDGAFRYDLGLIELLGLLVLCAAVYSCFDWRRSPPGQLTSILSITYAVGRFPLDFLRVADRRYLGFTPAQLACVALLVAGIVLLLHARRRSDPPPRR